ncbi:hypothetical protein Bbelb_253990 [Branchiostoma belcheri]|nr:hypothetical protein Bbelb_253990 [Branchiostoma belcheri]
MSASLAAPQFCCPPGPSATCPPGPAAPGRLQGRHSYVNTRLTNEMKCAVLSGLSHQKVLVVDSVLNYLFVFCSRPTEGMKNYHRPSRRPFQRDTTSATLPASRKSVEVNQRPLLLTNRAGGEVERR